MGKSSQIAVVTGLCLLSAGAGWRISGLMHGSEARAPQETSKTTKTKKHKTKKHKTKRPKTKYVCNVCGSTRGFKTAVDRKLEACRKCGAKARHRLLAHYLEHETEFYTDKLDVLHIGEGPGLRKRYRALDNLNYVTDTLRSASAIDVTAIDQPEASWDVVIAYHVLDQVMDDNQAMAELHRILRPGGQLVLQVQLWPSQTEIYEDASITDPKQRKRHFGQTSRVRKYAAKGLQERLEGVGFEVEIVDYLAQLDEPTVEKHRLAAEFKEATDQSIWVATKPAAEPSADGGSAG